MNKLYIDQSKSFKGYFWIIEENKVYNATKYVYISEKNKNAVKKQILNEDCLVFEYN